MLARSLTQPEIGDLLTNRDGDLTGGNNPLLYKPGSFCWQSLIASQPDMSRDLPRRRTIVTSMFCEEQESGQMKQAGDQQSKGKYTR